MNVGLHIPAAFTHWERDVGALWMEVCTAPRALDVTMKGKSPTSRTCFLYGTRRFITVFTKARHWTLSEPAQSSSPHRSLSP
jgi:hypothetical protein